MAPPRIDYNPLGPNGFRDLGHRIMDAVLGPTYRPFSAGGADGQRDGTFEGTPIQVGLPIGYWVIQYKHHDVANIGASTARTRLLGEVQKELEAWKANPGRKPDVLLFVTNVLATGVHHAGTFDKFDSLVQSIGSPHPAGTTILWDKARLDLLLEPLSGIRRDHGAISPADLVAALQGGQQVPALSETNDDDGIEIMAAASYIRDWCAVVVVTEIGNESQRKVAITSLELAVPGLGSFRPADVPDPGSKYVEGATWQGAGGTASIPPDEHRRWSWYIPVGDAHARSVLEREHRQGALVVRCFPGTQQQLDVTLDPPPPR